MRLKFLKGVVAVIFVTMSSLVTRATDQIPANPASDEAEIRTLLQNWAKAFHNRDITAIMSMYKPGLEFIAYDIVPPLQYVGYDAYKKDYEDFLAQYKGPIDIEYRDMHVVTSDTVAFAFGLERMSGILANGRKSDMWLRFTSGFHKIGGRWFDVHDHVSIPADLDSGKAMTTLTPELKVR